MTNGHEKNNARSPSNGRSSRYGGAANRGGTAVVSIATADSPGVPLCGKLLERGWTLYMYVPATAPLHLSPELASRGCRLLNADMSEAANSVKAAGAPVDLLLYCLDAPDRGAAAASGDSGDRFNGMLQDYAAGALGFLRFAEAFVPLMDSGRKRVAALAEPSGSWTEAPDPHGDGLAMAAAAIRMAMKIMANDLQRDGFTFRTLSPRPSGPKDDDAPDPDEDLLQALLSGPEEHERGNL